MIRFSSVSNHLDWNVDELIHTFEKELEVRESHVPIFGLQQQQHQPQPQQPKQQKQHGGTAAALLGSLRNHDGNGNYNAKFLLFQKFRLKRFLVFRSSLLPLRGSEVVLFDFTTWKPDFWRSVLQIWACEVKLSRFKCLSSK